ncbi:MAG: cyclic nucleotide-binding domain-containing protein [Xanthobacteraceae bacterium]|nr:cyclic nucleotide-binding domain-containing protein [Xanthobacteraceae bacterium]
MSISKSGDQVISAGCSLFRPTERCDAIYLLIDGWIVLYDLVDDGRRQILHFALPGALLGPSPSKIAVYGADALTDAKVSVVPQDKIGSMIAEHPGISWRLMWGL